MRTMTCGWRITGVLAVLLFGMSVPAQGQQGTGARADTLRGRVTDAQGNPIEGAEVLLPEMGRKVSTNGDGRFVVAGVPGGQITVALRRLGYAPLVRQVTAGGTGTTLVLRATPFQLEAVTVTAARRSLEPLGSPLPASAVGPQQLDRESSVSLAHTLQRLAGVRTFSTGEEIGKPVIRGFRGSSVLVLEDGMPLEDYSWSAEDAPSVDASLADRVEVIRGPASVLYGSDALGGVVNVIPEPLPEARAGQSFTRTSVKAYGASNNHELGSILKLEGARGNLGWHAVAAGRTSEALHTPTGELDNTGFLALNGEVAAGIQGDWGNGVLRYSRYGGEFKLLEANGPPPGVTEGEEGGPERKLSDDRIQLLANFPTGSLRIQTKVQWQRHWLQEVADEPALPGATPTGTEAPQFELLLNTFTGDLLAHHSIGPRVRGTVGVSGLAQTSDSRGPRYIIPNARVTSGGAFAFEQMTLGRVDLLAGVRGDLRSVRADPNNQLAFAGLNRAFQTATWDAGLVYRPVNELALTVNVGRAWRSPTLFELFANGPEIGDARFEIGNPDLQTESSVNVDAGVRWQLGIAHGEVAGYRNRVDHYIYLQPTANTQEGLQVYRHQQAQALLWGGEASTEVNALAFLTVGGAYDFVRGTNQETDEPLPLMPAPRGRIEAELHSQSLSWADRAFLSPEVELVARQTRLNPLDYPTDGYTLLNVTAGVQTRVAGHPTDVSLHIHNATNREYKDFLSRYKEFALSPGRNVVLSVETEF